MKELVLPSVNRPFVEALREVAGTAGTWSVIGGFAVWCHLGESHRPTLDIDTAAANEAHETLVALGTPGDSDHRRIVEGVELEIIEVLDPGPDVSDLDDKASSGHRSERLQQHLGSGAAEVLLPYV